MGEGLRKYTDDDCCGGESAPEPRSVADFDLGPVRRSVTSTSTEAQAWFGRGLVWIWSFNHEEAEHCFRKATEHDPECAMAWWGVAYAMGPYYNKQWHRFDPTELESMLAETHQASQRALALVEEPSVPASRERASEVERDLIRALTARHPQAEPVDDFTPWTDGYADAMRAVYADHSDDVDVAMLFAEAMLNRTPWKLWDLHTGEPAEGADTLEILGVLEDAIDRHDRTGVNAHAGLLHLHIHALEMSLHPERATPTADRLRCLVPDADHLCHMPGHVDVRCGRYREAVVANDRAIAAHRRYLALRGDPVRQATTMAHSQHHKLYAAMMLGDLRSSREAVDGIVDFLTEDVLRVESPPMADWVEGYVAMKVHPLIRFGRWEEILDEPFPDNRDLYCVTTAMLHYARTLAMAVLGEVAAADTEREAFRVAVGRVPASRFVFNNTCLDILKVAAAMADGELEYRRGNFDGAFGHLRDAVRLADDLPYDEPWGWMQPPRHALGALLLEQGRLAEAEEAYVEDLGLDSPTTAAWHHPDNVWALHGLEECLRLQGRDDEAMALRPRLEAAAARADIVVEASCLCRNGGTIGPGAGIDG